MDKNKILKKNISSGFIWKGLSLILTFLTVPFLLDYLGKEYYGIWITIFTLLNAAYFMDLGISLGLKNKLTEALAKKDFILAKTYISTAYISISFVAFMLLLVGVAFVLSFETHKIFNTNIAEKELKAILLLSIVLIFFSIIINIYKSILNAFQKSAKVEFAMTIYQGLVFLQIILLHKFINQSILIVSLVYGLTNIFIALIFTGMFFYNHKQILPSFKYFKLDKTKEILSLGFNFFFIQLALIIILSTDNLIITTLIGPESTATYSIINKLFQMFITLSLLISTPLWTLYTDAFQNKEYKWIKNTLRKLNYLFIILIVMLFILYFNFNWIIKLWIPQSLSYTNSLLLFMILFVIIRIYGDIYTTFLNGIGKIKLQMWLYVIGAIINIPLSIIFVKYFNLGSSGVILATSFSLIGLTIAMPIQAYKALKGNNIKVQKRWVKRNVIQE